MTTRHHGETEARAEGFEGRIEDVFEWITAHALQVVIGVIAFLAIGGSLAGAWEWSKRGAEAAQRQLAEAEIVYNQSMGAVPRAIFPPEPANPDQGVRAREAALEAFEAVAREHGGTVAAELAQVRAAEMELDLGRAAAAEQRLDALGESLDRDALVRGVALRLRGYALEELERWDEAGLAYAEAGAAEAYPDRPAAWLSSAESYRRAGDTDGELAAFQQILELDAEFAQRNDITGRLNALAGAGESLPPTGSLQEP